MAETQLPEQPEQFVPEISDQAPEQSNYDSNKDEVEISWTASEFIAHHKTHDWYIKLGAVAVAVAAIIYLLTRDKITAGFVLFGAFLMGVYAGRQPRQLPYTITNHGLTIDQKYYEFQSFRSFTVIPEGAFSSIVFIPLKRFGQVVSIYYAPEQEEQIVTVLSKSLPYDDQHNDPIDNLMRKIRF